MPPSSPYSPSFSRVVGHRRGQSLGGVRPRTHELLDNPLCLSTAPRVRRIMACRFWSQLAAMELFMPTSWRSAPNLTRHVHGVNRRPDTGRGGVSLVSVGA